MRGQIYGIALWVFLGGVALTLTAIRLPRWMQYSTSPSAPRRVRVTYGLHEHCSSLTGGCDAFPVGQDCRGADAGFCHAWRSVGFLMEFAAVIELAAVVGFAVALVGGRASRKVGWKVVAPMVGLAAVVQLVAMAVVAGLNDHNARFEIGWTLDISFAACTLSWIVQGAVCGGLVYAALRSPEEDEYVHIE